MVSARTSGAAIILNGSFTMLMEKHPFHVGLVGCLASIYILSSIEGCVKDVEPTAILSYNFGPTWPEVIINITCYSANSDIY